MKARTLSVYGDVSPRVPKARAGYATVPRQVTRRTDIRLPKIVLDALLGFCYGDERQCKPSIDEIAEACGMPRRTVQTHLGTLVSSGLIARRKDPDNPGGRWITYLLCDPKGFELDADTPRRNWRVLAPKPARPRAETGATPPYKQPTLAFSSDDSSSSSNVIGTTTNLSSHLPPQPPASRLSERPPETIQVASAVADIQTPDSSAFASEAARIADPATLSMAEAIAIAAERWPDMAGELPTKAAALLAKVRRDAEHPDEVAALVLEFVARNPSAKGPGLAFTELDHWRVGRVSLDEIREWVEGRRRLAADSKRLKTAAHVIAESRRAVPDTIDPDVERKTAETIAEMRKKGLKKWADGLVARSEEPGAGPATKQSPHPAETDDSRGDSSLNAGSEQVSLGEPALRSALSDPVLMTCSRNPAVPLKAAVDGGC